MVESFKGVRRHQRDVTPEGKRDVRLFTREEANALLPRLRPLVRDARESITEYRFHAEQMQDLEEMWGDGVREHGNPNHRDFVEHAQAAARHRRRAESALAELGDLGVELKDPLTGLVDFHAERDGERVYLCWREDELSVDHWHGLQDGFAGRQPL